MKNENIPNIWNVIELRNPHVGENFVISVILQKTREILPFVPNGKSFVCSKKATCPCWVLACSMCGHDGSGLGFFR